MLVNAIYLKAEWATWFDQDVTKPACCSSASTARMSTSR